MDKISFHANFHTLASYLLGVCDFRRSRASIQ